MKTKEEKLTFSQIRDDLDNISKKLYLDSPEVWIDFSDKVGEEKIDEMVLFYATKFNVLSVLKYAVGNNIIDLSIQSKNKNYTSIKEHLLAVSKDYESEDVYKYLSSNYKLTKNNTEETDTFVEVEKNNSNYYLPTYFCPNCNSNILKSGYKVYEEIRFEFSQTKNKLEEVNRKKYDKVFCSNCNKNIENVTLDILESICYIHNCKKCGNDLTKIGITEKTKMDFNDKDSRFIENKKTYNCPSCDEELKEEQIKYFNL